VAKGLIVAIMRGRGFPWRCREMRRERSTPGTEKKAHVKGDNDLRITGRGRVPTEG